MSHYNAKPLQLELYASRRLAIILAAAVVIVLVVLLMQPMEWWIKLLVGVSVLWAFARVIARDVLLLKPDAVVYLRLLHDGALLLRFNSGTEVKAAVKESTFVAAYLTVLNVRLYDTDLHDVELQEAGARRMSKSRSLILLPDALNADDFRRLRVWLRWGADASEVALSDRG